MSKYIPYQKCPVCDGAGQILADGFTSAVFQPCPTCEGKRIIPMFHIEAVEVIDNDNPFDINMKIETTFPIKGNQVYLGPASKAEEDNERANILDRGMSCKDIFEPDTTCEDIKE